MKPVFFKPVWQSCLLSLFLLYSTQGASAIYKWVDEQGNVHYGSQRPADNEAEKLKVQHHAPRDTSTYKRPSLNNGENTDAKPEQEAPAKEESKEKKPLTAAEKKKLSQACQQARQQLATMRAKAQIRVTDKDGKTNVLSQKQKEARIKKLQDAVTKRCK